MRREKYILDKTYFQIYNFQIILTIYNAGLTGNYFTYFAEIRIGLSDKVKNQKLHYEKGVKAL